MTMQLIPEWHPADAVVLAWPTEQTDWAPWLERAQSTYVKLIEEINAANAGVILLCAEATIPRVRQLLCPEQRVLIVSAQYNDTWVRDYGFLTVAAKPHNRPIEFVFNGWGNKFDATLDNQVNQRYLAQMCLAPIASSRMVAEGGALEIDGQGHLLSTASCLFNPERNGSATTEDYSAEFAKLIGQAQFTIFENGHLEGDDTDGHIDTLARFTPNKGIVVQASRNRPDDKHFAGLEALVDECNSSLNDHEVFTLPLPFIENEDGERLPASYANYLICNDKVLAPVYNQPEDEATIETLNQAYPEHDIVPVDCSVLVQQFGSLHCITMQVPTNTLKPSVVSQLHKGVTIYEAE